MKFLTDEIRKILSIKCPYVSKIQNLTKKYYICQATFLLCNLIQEKNETFASTFAQNITQNLVKTNLFKEMKPNDIRDATSVKILQEMNNVGNLIEFNWNCLSHCEKSLSISFKFFPNLYQFQKRYLRLNVTDITK